MRITVLCGGPSAERKVSLLSGQSVAQGLMDAGHDVFVSDISPTSLQALDHPCDVVFPVLHGEFGEDGQIQAILEQKRMAFVGSGSAASRLGMDKIAAKQRWKQAGLSTPGWQVVTSLLPANEWIGDEKCVVKAIDSGSSIDVFICDDRQSARHAMEGLVQRHGQCMIEQWIDGIEVTVGLLEGRALPPIRIDTQHEFFDYDAKYTKGQSEHSFDLKLPETVVQQCMTMAEKASSILGCRDLGRVDFMIDRKTLQPYLLEINTMPGFTSVSLLPEAAGRSGISFSELCDRLVKMAWRRSGLQAQVHVNQNSLVSAGLV